MKYQIKPLLSNSSQVDIEKTVYAIARAISLAGFSVTQEIYEQLLTDEQVMFTIGALTYKELV